MGGKHLRQSVQFTNVIWHFVWPRRRCLMASGRRSGPEVLGAHQHALRWGDAVPGEETLALEFGVARATRGQALAELARTGVLEQRHRGEREIWPYDAAGQEATLGIPVNRAEGLKREGD
jgi:hypothetical protein